MQGNMIVIRDPKTFCLNFDWPKDVNQNLRHKIEFIIKSNESLVEGKIKTQTEQLLPKYKIDEKPGGVEEIIIPSEKREKMLNELTRKKRKKN